MGLFRVLVLVALIWLVWRLIRPLLLKGRSSTANPNDNPQKMVACRWCGVHAPETEMNQRQGYYFCDNEHHRLWQEKQHDE
ncbi:MAG: hypothetical protein CVV10_06335 [Gammaproteobacteria bacterium HGW-Gammaproteobacteria-14]|nr:MAG: hypothetical protein CVV10_06335 [Gammaproteobacteria bacterium HGW-Gammaproteobacteria-14]